MRPRRFDQAQELADKFKDGQPVILNLEAADRDVARRLIDFASGVCYSLDGSMEKIATGVYLLKPPAARPPIRRLRELRPMALSPQRIRDTNFKAVRKGYDPAEVEAFVEEVAAALETAQNEATAMEAKARAAVARLQELSRQAGDGGPPASRPAAGGRGPRPTSTSPRRSAARCCWPSARPTRRSPRPRPRPTACSARPATTPPASLDQARAEATALVEAAKADARRAGESERVQVEGEVQALLARRDFLESDVDHLEQYLVAQRERIVEAVASLNDLVQRVPGGLADMRRPLLSAAADRPATEADADAAGDGRRRRRRRPTTSPPSMTTSPTASWPTTGERRRRARRDRRDHPRRVGRRGRPDATPAERLAVRRGRRADPADRGDRPRDPARG